jgi:hypothetical protein
LSELQRISRTCSLRALNSRTNMVRRSNSMNGLGLLAGFLLVASLQHIGRNTHCEPSLFHPGTGDNHDCTSTVLQNSGRSYHRKSALQRRFKNPVGTYVFGVSHECLSSEPCHHRRGIGTARMHACSCSRNNNVTLNTWSLSQN